MLSKLDELKSKVTSQNQPKITITTEFYLLAKELGCLGDLIGREYEFIYEENRLTGMKQKPMKISSFTTLMDEMELDNKRQAKMMKGRKR